MPEPAPRVIEVTVDYHGARRPRFPRALAVPVLVLILGATVLFSIGGMKSRPGGLKVRPLAISPCTVVPMSHVMMGYKPPATVHPAKHRRGCP